jgi:hypothetical protein
MEKIVKLDKLQKKKQSNKDKMIDILSNNEFVTATVRQVMCRPYDEDGKHKVRVRYKVEGHKELHTGILPFANIFEAQNVKKGYKFEVELKGE